MGICGGLPWMVGDWMDVEMFFGFFAGNWGETSRKDIWDNGWMLKFDFFFPEERGMDVEI